MHLLHVRRYDVDLIPAPDLTLEYGDRVGLLMPPERKDEVRRYFGDTVKAAAEFSYVSLGLGMVMGVLLGLIPIPIPGDKIPAPRKPIFARLRLKIVRQATPAAGRPCGKTMLRPRYPHN